MPIEKELSGKSGIYMWTSPSGKSYIGQTIDLGLRHKDFRCASINRKYSGKGYIIDKARQKYPYPEWKYQVLEFCSTEQLDEKEKYYINLYKPQYNITKGGIGGNGIPKSVFKKGHKMTEEQRAKGKETLRKHIEEGSVNYNSRSKKIALYNKDGSFIQIFDSVRNACDYIGIKTFSFTQYCRNNYLINKQYLVKYIDDNEQVSLFIEPYQKKEYKASEETKAKISKASKGKKIPSKWVKVIGTNEITGEELEFESITAAAQYIHPDNAKIAGKNIGSALAGKRRVAYGYFWRKEGEVKEMKKKFESSRGVKFSEERILKMREIGKLKMKPVDCFTKDGVFIETMPSVRDTEKKYGTTHVSQCCNEYQHSANGFIFKFHK